GRARHVGGPAGRAALRPCARRTRRTARGGGAVQGAGPGRRRRDHRNERSDRRSGRLDHGLLRSAGENEREQPGSDLRRKRVPKRSRYGLGSHCHELRTVGRRRVLGRAGHRDVRDRRSGRGERRRDGGLQRRHPGTAPGGLAAAVAALQNRVGLLFAGFFALLVLAGARTLYLGVLHGAALRKVAHTQQVTEEAVPAQRGTITDRDGVILATSEPADEVSATPYLVKDPLSVAGRLAPLLGRSRTQVLSDLSEHSGFVYLAHSLPAS